MKLTPWLVREDRPSCIDSEYIISVAASNENENKERVTRDYLRQMQDGETRTVHCSTPQEIESAASIAYQFSGNEGSTYKVSRNKAELTVTITKEAQ